MLDFDTLSPISQELNRRSAGTFKRGYTKGKQDANQYAIEQLRKLTEFPTELEIRREVPNLIKHLQEQE